MAGRWLQGGGAGGATGGGPATALQVEAVVVGGHCCELYPSLILRVGPESQVLFHAGAGLQRYCGEHHVRLARTSHILLSEMTSASTAGLDGVLLTLADIGQPKLLVVGPAGTRGCVEAASPAAIGEPLRSRFGPRLVERRQLRFGEPRARESARLGRLNVPILDHGAA